MNTLSLAVLVWRFCDSTSGYLRKTLREYAVSWSQQAVAEYYLRDVFSAVDNRNESFNVCSRFRLDASIDGCGFVL
jgi:hypothetical protein